MPVQRMIWHMVKLAENHCTSKGKQEQFILEQAKNRKTIKTISYNILTPDQTL